MNKLPGKEQIVNRVLAVSERFQHTAGHTRFGKAVTRAFTGSTSPMYEQLYWTSHNIRTVAGQDVELFGDFDAGRLARNWQRAGVLATSADELARLKDEHADAWHHEALAYYVGRSIHVGFRAETGLLTEIDNTRQAVAMRIGREPVMATVGLWLPAERTFVGSSDVTVERHNLPIANLPQVYPDVRLV